MNKLETGMYVRTKKYGIAKIIGGISDKFNIDVFKKDGCTLRCQKEKDILKASFNIIDLIEVGDYVNGERIISIIPIDICGNEILDNQHIFYKDGEIFEEIFEKDIKTVVTEEQFESMSYRIGE